MPICPQCSATIHAGADDQCPACGYSLLRADQSFGSDHVEFRRVQDSAGVLTHHDCQELTHFLEDLERKIPPVVLCIYTTNRGESETFRSHAHWILNHANIHHPSFGRRELHKAIEDAELRWREPGEAPPEPAPAPPANWLSRLGTGLMDYLRAARRHKMPPPVRHEWMLILVLDAQLERACFSWGYQLDPYINPDSINRCIVSAKLQFRERAMVPALRCVMKKVVREIAASSYRVNPRLRRQASSAALTLALGASLVAATALPSAAATGAEAAPATPAPPAVADGEAAAEAPAGTAPAATEAPPAAEPAAPPPPPPGAPASYGAAPRWHETDHRHLMAGELTEGYNMLLPQVAERPAPRFRSTTASSQESDKKILARYVEGYYKPSPAGLCDPQRLLTVEERRDVEHVLRQLNANGRFRIYAALYRHGQQLPQDLAVQNLSQRTAQPCEYTALLLFPLGDSQSLDLGYQEVKPTDEQRHAWLNRVRTAAAREGNGVESLLLAIREVHATLTPLAAHFRPITEQATKVPPRIEVVYKPDAEEEEESMKDKMGKFIADNANITLLMSLGIMAAFFVALILYFVFRHRSGRLLESVPDVRLSSPYGAGVSRYVRYLEGKESPKEKDRLFY